MASAKEWYRQPTWTPDAEAEFWRRWQRARPFNRPQYLIIQAITLTASAERRDHQVALSLLDRFFAEFPDERGHLASAWLHRGVLLESMGDIDGAIDCYFKADEHEHAMPHVIVHAPLVALYTVAIHGRRDLYDRALACYDRRVGGDTGGFPILNFNLQTALAFILSDRGDHAGAAECATRALAHASATRSGFSRHPTVGLVGNVDHQIKRRLESITSPSWQRSAADVVSRLIKGAMKKKAKQQSD